MLIRGGGDSADFAVFEAPQVIEALGTCRAYRLLGLGHSRDRTLADCVADYAASVPAEAGRHLARKIAEARRQSYPALVPETQHHRNVSLPRQLGFRARRIAVVVGAIVILLLLLNYLG